MNDVLILFLDDMEERHKKFMGEIKKGFVSRNVIVKQAYSMDEAIEFVENNDFDVMFLDHDLSLEMIMCDPNDTNEKSGSRFSEWLVNFYEGRDDKPQVICHSLNPGGRENMARILSDAGFTVDMIPFTILFR